MFYIVECIDKKYTISDISNPNKLYDTIVYINETLTKSTKCESFDGSSPNMRNFIHSNTIIISWETDTSKFGLGYLEYSILEINPKPNNYSDKMKPYIDVLKKHFELLLLPKDILKSNSGFVDKLKCLDPDALLYVMTNKCLTDPCVLLVDALDYDITSIYQTFVHYLNKTICSSDEPNFTDLLQISKDFFRNGDNSKDSDRKLFDDLLLFYIQNKNLTPINIKYTKYVPTINQ